MTTEEQPKADAPSDLGVYKAKRMPIRRLCGLRAEPHA